MSKFKVGDRVSIKSINNYSDSFHNPFNSVGTVTVIQRDQRIIVKWENKLYNGYNESDLDLVGTSEEEVEVEVVEPTLNIVDQGKATETVYNYSVEVKKVPIARVEILFRGCELISVDTKEYGYCNPEIVWEVNGFISNKIKELLKNHKDSLR